MSKKNLKDGLESLFGGPAVAEPSLPENSPLLEQTSRKGEQEKSAPTTTKYHRRSKSGKNFTSDLDTLFEAAQSDPIREKPSSKPQSGSSTSRRVVGLDALIQKTTDDNIDYTSTKKRVTFIFEKKKLDKLKRIAKLENAYLKDIIDKIVGNHISKYDEDGRLKT